MLISEIYLTLKNKTQDIVILKLFAIDNLM